MLMELYINNKISFILNIFYFSASGVIGVLQAVEAIKIIKEKPVLNYRLLVY